MRETDRIKLNVSFEELINENFFLRNVTLTELQADDLIIGHSLNFSRDVFDRHIVATALRLELPLITADGAITEAKPCEIFWR